MTDEQWTTLRYFKPNENWGIPEKMNYQLLFLLDCFRAHIDRPCIVTSGTQGVHSKFSQHYGGNAVDFVVDLIDLEKLDVILEMMKFPFSGLGIYPQHGIKGTSRRAIGFHVDNRAVSGLPRGIVQARWLKEYVDGKTKEWAVTKQSLSRFGIV